MEQEDTLALFRDDRQIPAEEEEGFWKSLSENIFVVGNRVMVIGQEDPNTSLEAKLREFGLQMRPCVVPVEREVPVCRNFRVLVPVRENCWEAQRSAVIPQRNVATPAREIAEHLDLCGQPQTFDLFEKNGRRASITLEYGDLWHNGHKLTYLRQDLLERFLKETDSGFVWVIWGNREFYSRDVAEYDAVARRMLLRKTFQMANGFWPAAGRQTLQD